MLHVKRITLIAPEYSQPLMSQEIRISSKVRTIGVVSAGTCTYVCKFEKDVLYPDEAINL